MDKILETTEVAERLNPFCVISKETFGEHGAHDIQTNSCWSSNPYGDDYVIVPDDMVKDIIATGGYCDIELDEEGVEVISFTPRDIPEKPKKEFKPSMEDRVQALENAMLEMLGVTME